MADVTQLLNAIDAGDPQAAAQLLPLVYDELRKLAAARMAAEAPGHTLNATALVHEAYLRLVECGARHESEGNPTLSHASGSANPEFANRRHFFAAAAEAMRRILVDHARSRLAAKRGAGRRVTVDLDQLTGSNPDDDVLSVHDALDRLAMVEPRVANLVTLRYFAGLTIPEAAEALGIAPRTADAWWAYARAWLAADLT